MVDPVGAPTSLWLRPYILDPNQRTMMYLAADDVLWRNSDLTAIPDGNSSPIATNWAVLTGDPGGQPITALAMSRSPARTLWFGTATGRLYRLDGAATAAPGAPATRLDVGAGFPAGAYVSSIAVHPADDQQVLVAFSNYNVVNIFASSDRGLTWTAVEGNLGGPDSPSVRSVAFVPAAAGDQVLAATSTGLYSTQTLAGAATVWQQEADGLVGNVVVDMIAVRPGDGVVVAGTHGKGVVQGRPGFSPVPDVPADPDLVLGPNAPNPFNPVTRIPFTTGVPGRVRLRVFDVAGREVKTLLDAWCEAGAHAETWNGTDAAGRPVAAGTYVCRLEQGRRQASGTMVLIK